jgi:hypothetical protein
MSDLIVGYFGLILKMAVEMVIVAWIWKKIAKIRIPKLHLIGIVIFAAVIYIIQEESMYKATGHYSTGHPETSTALGFVFLYLVVWTVILKIRDKKENQHAVVTKACLLPACATCGATYDPREYSHDAPEWLCPQCHKPLPKE